jgi:hypothetical protein
MIDLHMLLSFYPAACALALSAMLVEAVNAIIASHENEH